MVEKRGKKGRVGKPNGKSTTQTTSINNFDLSDERFCMFIGDHVIHGKTISDCINSGLNLRLFGAYEIWEMPLLFEGGPVLKAEGEFLKFGEWTENL